VTNRFVGDSSDAHSSALPKQPCLSPPLRSGCEDWYDGGDRDPAGGPGAKSSLVDINFARNKRTRLAFFKRANWRMNMMKSLFAAAMIVAIATPVLADEAGVRVGPVGAGVTVGEPHDQYRDRDRDHTTVIREREPRDSTTVIKKEDADGNRSKTVIHHDN
jgi:hypothetical protein